MGITEELGESLRRTSRDIQIIPPPGEYFLVNDQRAPRLTYRLLFPRERFPVYDQRAPRQTYRLPSPRERLPVSDQRAPRLKYRLPPPWDAPAQCVQLPKRGPQSGPCDFA